MAVWAVFGRQAAGGRWYLKSVSVFSAERARDLVERDLPGPGVEDGGRDLVVREFATLQAVPWVLDASRR